MHVEIHDIVGIMNMAFHNAFGKTKNYMKAIADRGWKSLTFTLLDHRELVKERNIKASLSSVTNCLLTGIEPIHAAESLNLSQKSQNNTRQYCHLQLISYLPGKSQYMQQNP
jgi:hypothetical protein